MKAEVGGSMKRSTATWSAVTATNSNGSHSAHRSHRQRRLPRLPLPLAMAAPCLSMPGGMIMRQLPGQIRL